MSSHQSKKRTPIRELDSILFRGEEWIVIKNLYTKHTGTSPHGTLYHRAVGRLQNGRMQIEITDHRSCERIHAGPLTKELRDAVTDDGFQRELCARLDKRWPEGWKRAVKVKDLGLHAEEKTHHLLALKKDSSIEEEWSDDDCPLFPRTNNTAERPEMTDPFRRQAWRDSLLSEIVMGGELMVRNDLRYLGRVLWLGKENLPETPVVALLEAIAVRPRKEFEKWDDGYIDLRRVTTLRSSHSRRATAVSDQILNPTLQSDIFNIFNPEEWQKSGQKSRNLTDILHFPLYEDWKENAVLKTGFAELWFEFSTTKSGDRKMSAIHCVQVKENNKIFAPRVL